MQCNSCTLCNSQIVKHKIHPLWPLQNLQVQPFYYNASHITCHSSEQTLRNAIIWLRRKRKNSCYLLLVVRVWLKRKRKIVVICYWWSMVRVGECPPVITLFPLPSSLPETITFILYFLLNICPIFTSLLYLYLIFCSIFTCLLYMYLILWTIM